MEENTPIMKKRLDNESFQDFITRFFKEMNIIPKKTKKIVIPYLNEESEYFIYENKQITIYKGKENFYRIYINDIPKSFVLKYGCELETCFVLNCSTDEFDDFIKEKIKEKKELIDREYTFPIWEELILFHIQKNIAPKLSKEFLEKFPYAYVMSYHSYGGKYIDLSTGKEILDNVKVDDYKSIQFAQDASLKCGDTEKDNDSLTVHCEIISPILNDFSDIKLLYDNLISSSCNVSNYSTAFHVNISINEMKNKKLQKIRIRNGMLFEICKDWYKFEKDNYVKYRGEEIDPYANNIYKNSDDAKYMKTIFQKRSGEAITEEEIFIPEDKYGVRTLLYVNEIYNKYRSLHFKSKQDLLEFRIFPSSNNTNELIEYTKISLDFIEKSMKSFLKNKDYISSEYNRINSKYKINEIYNVDFDKYSGSLYFFKKKYFDDSEDEFQSWFKNRVQTEIDEEQEQVTTFLFFFKESHKIRTKKIITGLIPGEHHYVGLPNSKVENLRGDIIYLPENDFIELKNYKL
jgi:hypothetical protein